MIHAKKTASKSVHLRPHGVQRRSLGAAAKCACVQSKWKWHFSELKQAIEARSSQGLRTVFKPRDLASYRREVFACASKEQIKRKTIHAKKTAFKTVHWRPRGVQNWLSAYEGSTATRYYKEETAALSVAFSRAKRPLWCTVAPVLAIPAHTKAKNARLLRS